MQERWDFVVIGSGPAGEKAAALAAYHGKRVVVIERDPRPGGVMVSGVAATKTMREAALYLTSFRRRDVYGVGLDLAPEQALAGIRSRAQQVGDLLTDSAQRNLDQHGITVLHGSARLAGPHAVEVTPTDGEPVTLITERILIATGSRPFHPPGMPFDHPDVLDSDTARLLDRPVGRLTVIGGGAVACEYASIFAAVGSRVTLVESSGRVLPFMDSELADLLVEAFRAMGMDVLLGVGRAKVEADGDHVVAVLPDGRRIASDKVIVAAGRVGNTEELSLTEAGVATDERGLILVDEHQTTSVPGVYAAGDVTGPPALASVSMEQGRVAAAHAFGVAIRDIVDPLAPFGVYSIPEAAMVGLTEDAARTAGVDVAIGHARLARNARALISGATDGVVKLLVRRGDRAVVGAHILGDNATELIHQVQAVMAFGGTVDYFIRTTYNVPTQSEALKYAAYDALSHIEDRPTLTSYV